LLLESLVLPVLGGILGVIGAVGYALRPSNSTIPQTSAMLKYLPMFYILLNIFMLLHLPFRYTLNTYFGLIETVIALLLIAICLSVIASLRRFFEFDLSKVKDILIYGSIVWLMGKETHAWGLHTLAEMVIFSLSSLVAIFSLYLFYQIRKTGVFFIEKDELIHLLFPIAFFFGLGILGEGIEIIEMKEAFFAVVAVLIAYVFWIIYRITKPLLE